MAAKPSGVLLRCLHQIALPSSDPRDDRELLDAFASQRDHAAFALLVRRHGPMVLNVCRRVLHHEQDAEDAFQAAFLVLAAKAGAIAAKTVVAGYLHGIAYHVALKARREAARRRRREACARPRTVPDAAEELNWREVQAILEQEIQRLPEKYRTPFVLCCLEGLSRAEAGRQLGLKEGTVWSRLSQARARLQERLTRRGIALTAVLGALAVSEKTVRAGLAEAVVQGARQSAAGFLSGALPPRVAMLAQAGMQTMASKVKCVLAGLVTVLLVGAGGVAGRALTPQAPETPQPAKAAAEPKKPEAPRVRTDRHGDPLPAGAIARLGTVRWRHGFFVHRVAFSPDGKKLAAVGCGRAVTMWDAATGRELCQFPNRGQPNGLAFSPDGKILATTYTPACNLWDAATGKELRQLKGHNSSVNGVAFSPDGRIVTTAGGDGTVRLWVPATGDEKRRIECGQGVLYTVAFSPDGKQLASGGADSSIRLWDAQTGEERHRLAGHAKGVLQVAFAPDGKRLASAGEDETVRLWDAATGRQVRVLVEKRGTYVSLAFSPDGTQLATGHFDGTIHLWDVADGTETRHWRVGAMTVRALAFAPDGKTLACGGAWDSGIHLWDIATGREKHPSDEHHGFIDLVRFSPNGKTLLSVGRDRRVLWWDLASGTPHRQAEWSTAGFFTALSPDGETLAVSSWLEHDVRLWNLRSGKARTLIGKQEKRVRALAYSPDGRLLAWGGEGSVIHVCDTRDGKEVRRFKDIPNEVWCLRFSPDGRALAAGLEGRRSVSGQATLRLWDLATGEERVRFPSLATNESALAFSPDGAVLASGSSDPGDPIVRLWDVATGRQLIHHTGHREAIGTLAFSPDGKLVASGAGDIGRRDNSVHVWEAATGRLLHCFEGHHSCASSVSFSPDGLTVASGAGDSTILLWDVTGRRPDRRWHAKPLTPRELDACWTALASEDAARAYDAVWRLVAAPEQAVPFLQKHLPPIPRPDEKRVQRLLADLNSDDFKVRQRATDELSALGDAIVPALRQALAGKPELEARRRVQQLLDQTRDWNAERLRDHRAIQALEHLGTKSACALLEVLAAGAPEARRTEEAKAALRRPTNR